MAFEHQTRLFPDNETATDASSMVTDDKTSMIYSLDSTAIDWVRHRWIKMKRENGWTEYNMWLEIDKRDAESVKCEIWNTHFCVEPSINCWWHG